MLITKHHMLGVQTAETLSPSPGSWNPQMEEVGGARPPGLAPWPGDVGPSPCVLTQSSPVCVCILIVSPYKDTSYQVRAHLTTSLPGSPLKGPLQIRSHPELLGVSSPTRGFLLQGVPPFQKTAAKERHIPVPKT